MIELIILGIVQGFTEFLPVSSSGHLAVLQKLFGLSGQAVEVSIILHLGTLFAVMVFFFKDCLNALRSARVLGYIAVVTLITGSIGVFGKDFFEGLFMSSKAVSIGWIASGIMLLMTARFLKGSRSSMGLKDALILGVTQGIAIIPGVSRSGTTISTLLFRGIDKMSAFSFSFLISIPAILGATLLEAKDIGFALKGDPAGLAAGFTVSFISGIAALFLLKRMIAQKYFHVFGYYCVLIGTLTFIFLK